MCLAQGPQRSDAGEAQTRMCQTLTRVLYLFKIASDSNLKKVYCMATDASSGEFIQRFCLLRAHHMFSIVIC